MLWRKAGVLLHSMKRNLWVCTLHLSSHCVAICWIVSSLVCYSEHYLYLQDRLQNRVVGLLVLCLLLLFQVCLSIESIYRALSLLSLFCLLSLFSLFALFLLFLFSLFSLSSFSLISLFSLFCLFFISFLSSLFSPLSLLSSLSFSFSLLNLVTHSLLICLICREMKWWQIFK